ncbi:ABC transporter permease [Gemmata sp. JC717]|uniref:ABC transporter permease n=1 Tax=Gemmata algarum TaxID=2975278 RepID=UPI0021BAAC49|nr:ABC transporter permease [Gemmata algarum]MDY3554859.1 ABC transporter permease [Gemmata algarum]
MQQFFAILKDSFREAVDGFVIYVMLGLALLMVALVGSVSYEPEGPGAGLPKVLDQFNIVFPDKGRSQYPVGIPMPLAYTPSEAGLAADGTMTFNLTVEYTDQPFRGRGPAAGNDAPKKEDSKDEKKDAKEEPKPKPKAPGGMDVFRFAIAAWKLPAGEKIKEDPRQARNRFINQGGGEKKLEIVMPPNMKPEDIRGVSDEDMVEFLQSQFVTFVGASKSDVVVKRKPGVAEPEYQFEVTLKSVTGARGWPHKIHILFKAFTIDEVPLGVALWFVQDQLVNGIGAAVTLLLSIVITAFFIPNMLRKGSLDLLISKPIGRVQLLIYKYIGGLTFIFLVSTFTIGLVWLVMAIRSGFWDPSFLLVIPALTFTFAVVYAVSTLIAVLTRSAIASILLSVGFMFVMWLIGGVIKGFFDRNKVTQQFNLPEWSYTLVDTLNNILPRYKDLDKLTTKLIADTNLPTGLSRLLGLLVEFPSFGGAVSVSLLFIALMLGLASWRFAKRDG